MAPWPCEAFGLTFWWACLSSTGHAGSRMHATLFTNSTFNSLSSVAIVTRSATTWACVCGCMLVGVVKLPYYNNWAWLIRVVRKGPSSHVCCDLNRSMLSTLTATVVIGARYTSRVTRFLVASRSFSFSRTSMATLESLNFDNRALRSLPIDPNEEVYSRSVAGKKSSLGITRCSMSLISIDLCFYRGLLLSGESHSSREP